MPRPVKSMFSVKQTFKSFESGSGGISTNIIGKQNLFIFVCLYNIK